MEAGLPTGATSFVTFSRPCRGAKRAERRRRIREAGRQIRAIDLELRMLRRQRPK